MKKINVVVTAGGMQEKIDNVRKITNSSTGKLGVKIANELLKKDNLENIYYVCSKESLKPTNERVKIITIDGVRDLKDKVTTLLKDNNIDFFIHSMAVSDYYVSSVSTPQRIIDDINNSKRDVLEVLKSPTNPIIERKISSDEENIILTLKKAPKIISLIKDISPQTYLVGFKLLDGVAFDELIAVASRLRDKNNCDLVIANDLNEIRQGNHKAYIIDKEDQILEVSGKEEIAKSLVKRIFR